MSKAFVREDADSDDELESAAPRSPAGKNYITPEGFARLQAEKRQLLELERPEVVKTVAWAASLGDRSENADYLYGKKRLREIDRRVRFLIKRLEAAQIVHSAGRDTDQIYFGAQVRVKGAAGERTVRIVGVDEWTPSAATCPGSRQSRARSSRRARATRWCCARPRARRSSKSWR